jgi:hypothetical protein
MDAGLDCLFLFEQALELRICRLHEWSNLCFGCINSGTRTTGRNNLA